MVAGAIADELRAAGRLMGLCRDKLSAIGPERGLYAYHIERHGGLCRVHLRIQDDGTGVLFVDVSEAVHLSETAVELAWLVLEGANEAEARRWLARRYRGARRAQVRMHYRFMLETIDRLTDPRSACRVCSTDLSKIPLFSARPSAPYKADLALTYKCDNGCPHCYNEKDRFGIEQSPATEWKRVVEVLKDAGVPQVILTGGEPTIHPGLVDIVAHATGAGLICGMNTNGRRLGRGAYMEDLAAAGLDHVQVTLQSHRGEIHDAMVGAPAFEQTVRGIEAAVGSGVHVITNTTLTRVNYRDAEQVVRFAHSMGLRCLAMNGLIHSGGGGANPDELSLEALPAILARTRDVASELGMRFLWYTVTEHCRMSPLELDLGVKRCNAGEYSICIEPNGDVLPCQSYYAVAGNILRDPWEQIWKGDLLQGIRERTDNPRAAGLPERCWDCPDLQVCAGGCPLARKASRSRLSICERFAEEQHSNAITHGDDRRGSGAPAIDRSDINRTIKDRPC